MEIKDFIKQVLQQQLSQYTYNQTSFDRILSICQFEFSTHLSDNEYLALKFKNTYNQAEINVKFIQEFKLLHVCHKNAEAFLQKCSKQEVSEQEVRVVVDSIVFLLREFNQEDENNHEIMAQILLIIYYHFQFFPFSLVMFFEKYSDSFSGKSSVFTKDEIEDALMDMVESGLLQETKDTYQLRESTKIYSFS